MPLNGLRVLIVEDQYLIADEMRRAVTALGGTVVGPCSTVEDAIAKLKSEEVQRIDFQGKFIDFRIAGEKGEAAPKVHGGPARWEGKPRAKKEGKRRTESDKTSQGKKKDGRPGRRKR